MTPAPKYRRGPTPAENRKLWACANKIWEDDAHAEVHKIMAALYSKAHLRLLTPSQVSGLMRVVCDGVSIDAVKKGDAPSSHMMGALAAARAARLPHLTDPEWARYIRAVVGHDTIATQADARRLLIYINRNHPTTGATCHA